MSLSRINYSCSHARFRCRSYYRDVHGVLLLDKPKGVSSNNALQIIKKIYNVNRAGHTGTLDPLASGMLPICLGEARKFSKYMLDSDKRYRVIAKLGQRTDTSDSYGKIVEERPLTFSLKKLNVVLERFRGSMLQVPSIFSAIKYHGKKLYEYARQGVLVSRKARLVKIYELLLIRYERTELELEIHCSKGTYIRTIIDDLGEELGCGAHVTYLRRLGVSRYSYQNMVTLEKLYSLVDTAKVHHITPARLLDPLLMPIDSLVANFPVVNLPLVSSMHFKKGNPVSIANMSLIGPVRVTEGEDSKFIGMGEINDKGKIAPRRLMI